MTPKPVALVQLVVQKLMAPKPVALPSVCAFLLVDQMNYLMKKKMNSDESCQQVSRS